MISFLSGNKTELTLTLDREDSAYFSGQTVSGTIHVRPAKDLKLRGGKVFVIGSESYKYRSLHYTDDGEGGSMQEYRTSWNRNQFFSTEQNLLGKTVLLAGKNRRFSFQMGLPNDSPPSCAGEILRVQWQVGVVFDRPWAGDLNANAQLVVRSQAPGLNMKPGAYGQSSEPDEAELAFLLPGLEAVVDQQLNGQLRIRPRKEFDSKVRLELLYREHVPYDRGNSSEKRFALKLAGMTRFTPGQEQIIPFRLSFPPESTPSIRAPNGAITWKLKGILDRPLRRDTSIEQSLEVYSA